jgi:hypothetical protein
MGKTRRRLERKKGTGTHKRLQPVKFRIETVVEEPHQKPKTREKLRS